VFFCCDWGVTTYHDPEFGVSFQWDISLTDGYASEMLPIGSRPTRLGFWQVDNPAVGSALDRYQPDVVQLFGYAHRTNWRVRHWARRNRVPILIYSDSILRGQTPLVKRWLKRAVVGWFYKGVDGALYVGDNNRAFHRSFGLPDERLFLGVLPIDMRTLLKQVPSRASARAEIRHRYGIPLDEFVVLFCGKLSQRKRPLDLVAAISARAHEPLKVHAIFLGDGQERAEIEGIVRREHLQNVHLAGFVNQSGVPKFYAATDALVVTSSFDPHPLVVSEAAVFGLPVIVSGAVGCVGPMDTARIGENALVYPCGDVERLRACITRLSSDHLLYTKMAESSAAIAKTQDIGVAAKQLNDSVFRLKGLGPRP
jgi:glycosyltransferase involved in cell wall biosynthesis